MCGYGLLRRRVSRDRQAEARDNRDVHGQGHRPSSGKGVRACVLSEAAPEYVGGTESVGKPALLGRRERAP